MTAQSLESLAALLKRARQRKGLSQRALSERVGLPQSHLSKIENGNVDLQASNLIEIARALDLEVALLPRGALPALKALAETAPEPRRADPLLARDLRRANRMARELVPRFAPLTIFDELIRVTEELRELLPALRDVDPLRRPVVHLLQELEQLRAKRDLRRNRKTADAMLARIASYARELREQRNALAHETAEAGSAVVPAYRLDESDDRG